MRGPTSEQRRTTLGDPVRDVPRQRTSNSGSRIGPSGPEGWTRVRTPEEVEGRVRAHRRNGPRTKKLYSSERRSVVKNDGNDGPPRGSGAK